MNIAYVEASCNHNDCEEQVNALVSYPINKWIFENIGDKSNTCRQELQLLLENARQKDIIFVEKLSRIADSIDSFLNVFKALVEKNVGLVSLRERFDLYSSISLDNHYNNSIKLLIEYFEELSKKHSVNEEIKNSSHYGFEKDDLQIGVNAFIFNENNQLLLGKRRNAFGSGLFSLIGGKLKAGESIKHCIIRELYEELGVLVDEKDIKIVNMSFVFVGVPMVEIGTEIVEYKGNIYNKASQQCECIRYFDIIDLPEIFPVTMTNIELYNEGKFYDFRYNILK